MAVVKFRNGGAIEERQAMKFSERIRDLIVMSVDLANPIHWSSLKNHLPSVALTPSQTAPTKPVTITVMTALKV